MKIFTSTQIRELDAYTIEHEPVSSLLLMERAARAVADDIGTWWPEGGGVTVFAGPGNNGGDALAVARMLAEEGYRVSVYLFNIHNKLSPDCEANRKRTADSKRLVHMEEVTLHFDPPRLDADTLVVDGLFGSGLDKPLTGGFAALVKYINQSEARVVSIDLPSGLMPEDNTYNVRANIIRAHVTLTFQQKKLAMLLADNQPFVGEVRVLDIGLSPQYIADTEARFSICEEAEIRALMRPRPAFAHKGEMGHALLIAGSRGMAGAAILAARACLRTGAGKVTVATPSSCMLPLQVAVPEAVLNVGRDEERFVEATDTDPYDAVAMGPGIGRDEHTAIAMIAQIRRTHCTMVADADALNMLATHRAWIYQLPHGMVMTPHVGEMERLLGNTSNGCYERLTKTSELATQIQATILLKGHYSALCLPTGEVIFCPTGNAGMATAGSGDVLTGIITALIARGHCQRDACLMGMYLHGLAGDMAAAEMGEESLMASDIIRHLPKAILHLTENHAE